MKKNNKLKTVYTNKWISIISSNIRLDDKNEYFYSMDQADYVSVIAKNNNNKFPMVRQYRHAVNKYTLEFPSGMLEKNETPILCAKKEVYEETGYAISKIKLLSKSSADVGRLRNNSFLFYAEVGNNIENFNTDKKIKVFLYSKRQIIDLIKMNKIIHQPHISMFYLAQLNGFI